MIAEEKQKRVTSYIGNSRPYISNISFIGGNIVDLYGQIDPTAHYDLVD